MRTDGDCAADLDRRIKQIMHRNPGHDASSARAAAEAEASASRATLHADPADLDAARLHLRAMQLRTANLDLDPVAARDLARIQMGR